MRIAAEVSGLAHDSLRTAASFTPAEPCDRWLAPSCQADAALSAFVDITAQIDEATAPAKERTAEPMPRSDGQWVSATASSCEDTCAAAGLRAVSSGVYTNGEKFFVCATDYNGEGFRPGYNLRPSDGKCVVGWAGQEVNGISYVCLCQ